MERSEQDTVIVINQADRREGYFTFSTTYRPHWQKLLKRVGRANLVITRETPLSDPYPSYQAQVPYAYLSKANFGVRNRPYGGGSRPQNQSGGQANEK